MKVVKFLVKGYLLFLFLPYIFIFLMYFLLKKMAKPGSEVEAQVHELELELINVVIRLIQAIDINFILMNISGLLLLICLIYFLKKYKIIIPRRTSNEETKSNSIL